MKCFCFRFDVDTPKCIQIGVPNLIKLSKELDVPFTFFVNMGRGTSRRSFIKKNLFIKKNNAGDSTQKLSNLSKLGLWHYLFMAITNPQVGNSHPKIIQDLEMSGHEVGLHGGSNHGEWQNESHSWSKQKFLDEVAPALQSLTKYLGKKPTGFSSPGWKGSIHLHGILESLGFAYVADAHGGDLKNITCAQNASTLWQVPTNIIGEPGGVAYLENLRALGMDDKGILKDFTSRLNGEPFSVIYDHPCYAGIKELPMLKEMIALVRSKGFKIVTLNTLAKTPNLQIAS